MMGIVLIILCLLGTGTQYSVAVDELSSEQILAIVNETNNADIGHGEFEILIKLVLCTIQALNLTFYEQ